MKSLLTLLTEEDLVVREINACESSVSFFQERRDEVERITYNCSVKKADLESCDRLIKEYQNRAEQYSRQLLPIREQLYEYLKCLKQAETV